MCRPGGKLRLVGKSVSQPKPILKSVEIKVELLDLCSSVTLRQTFENTSSEAIEVEYDYLLKNQLTN